MYNFQLYDHLLQFSLFQGLSRTELLQMAGNTKFGFLKLSTGKTVIADGKPCAQLIFLIQGSFTLTTCSDDHGYAITEHLSAPWLLQPEALFGLSPHYTSTAVVTTDAQFITLSKDEVLRLLDDFLIVRLNYLNLMATIAQRRYRQSWHRPASSLRHRIARFLTDRCAYPSGRKTIHILMKRLATEMNDSRLDVSRALNDMQDEGLLTLHRGRIEVPSLERLFM